MTGTHSSDKGCLHEYLSSTTVRQLTTAQRTSSHSKLLKTNPDGAGASVASQEAAVSLTNSKRLRDSQALKKLWLTLLFHFLFMSVTMWEMLLPKNHG